MKQGNIGSFFKRPQTSNEPSFEGSSKRPCSNSNQSIPSVSNVNPQTPQNPQPTTTPTHSTTNADLNDLPQDPADRPRISTYNPNQRDEVRRAYLLKGPCQPKGHTFPSKLIGSKHRRFVVGWFDHFDWLEYSKKEDKAYCLNCYVFGDMVGQQGGRDAFVTEGFNSWSKKEALRIHVGNVGSLHNKARQKCEFLLKEKQSISFALNKQTELELNNYKIRLLASVKACIYLLKNALPFRGHDESSDSISRGLFIDTISLIRDENKSIFDVTLENAPQNNQVTCPRTQKQLVECFSKEITSSICNEIGDDVFGLLVDESSDVSLKEQMAIVLRYVDSLGIVKERFIAVVHVKDTSSLTLKNAIDDVLTSHKLSITQIRGQGYDGASNMRGAFNGLKALILQENELAHYVHCFAHQLQLVIVAVAKKHEGVKDFFEQIALVVNVVCASCKRKDILREKARESVQKAIGKGELETGRGLNQESSLARAGDTRWGSHLKTIISLMKLYPEILEVLAYVEEEGSTLANRNQAAGILSYFKSLDFIFYLHLMFEVFSLTGILSKHLQRKDQDILEAASLVRATMDALKALRDTGFDNILSKVFSFRRKHDMDIVDMTDNYVTSRNRRTKFTNQYHYEVEIFNTVVDMQVIEIGDRFSELSTQLLEYMGALSPCNSFARFDKTKLLKLSELYKDDFDDSERGDLEGELEIYYHAVHKDDRFIGLKGIADLSRLLVELGKHRSYPLVYRLLKLVLVLPVATATVERCFSAMKLIKTDLRNKMGDDFMNDALVCNVEKEALLKVKLEDVMERFQKMSTRKFHI
ncbi:hypothetical protein L2E82_13960 [Cichorium intybus]|uniref:Uncharacterized protein n=1 Tax=Cichorium intybus TaxID=13427 RepID=A0ACB9EZY3_CICIN|nr:hypothetical protein L2E82_13960 [Cichorium intybus]